MSSLVDLEQNVMLVKTVQTNFPENITKNRNYGKRNINNQNYQAGNSKIICIVGAQQKGYLGLNLGVSTNSKGE